MQSGFYQVRTVSSVLAALILAACGGGGGGGGDSAVATPTPIPTPIPTPVPAASAAEGVWIGSTSNGRIATGLVQGNGNYWVLYSVANNPALLAGAIQGQLSASGGTLTSSNAKDYNLEGNRVLNATFNGNYTSKSGLGGTIFYPALSQSITLSTNYDAAYDQQPSLATIAGTYSGSGAVTGGGEFIRVTVGADGKISGLGLSTGCAFSGTASPLAKGNAYNLSVTFAGGTCLLGTATLQGLGYFDAVNKRLYGAAQLPDRSNALIFVGAR